MKPSSPKMRHYNTSSKEEHHFKIHSHLMDAIKLKLSTASSVMQTFQINIKVCIIATLHDDVDDDYYFPFRWVFIKCVTVQ